MSVDRPAEERHGTPTGNLRFVQKIEKHFGDLRQVKSLQQEMEDMHGCMFWRDVPVVPLTSEEIYALAD